MPRCTRSRVVLSACLAAAICCTPASAQRNNDDDGPEIIRTPSVEPPARSTPLLTIAGMLGGLLLVVLPAFSPSKRGHKD